MARTLVKRITENKNYLINGAFDFWQRNVGTGGPFTEDTSLAYKGPDRWRHRFDDLVAPSTVRAWARIFDAPVTISTGGTPSAFRAIYRRGNTGIYNAIMQQRIESHLSRELYIENPSGVMSIGCWVKSATTNSVRITVFTPTAQDNHASQSQVYQQTFSFTANDTWQQIKFENLTVTSAMVNGLAVQFEMLSPAAVGADGADRDVRFSMAQLNKGAVVAPFELAGRNRQQELMLCQRYYEKSFDIETNPGIATSAGTVVGAAHASGNNVGTTYCYKATKRTVPVINIYDVAGNLNRATAVNTGTGAETNNINVTGAWSVRSGANYFNWQASTSVAGFAAFYVTHFTADAEL